MFKYDFTKAMFILTGLFMILAAFISFVTWEISLNLLNLLGFVGLLLFWVALDFGLQWLDGIRQRQSGENQVEFKRKRQDIETMLDTLIDSLDATQRERLQQRLMDIDSERDEENATGVASLEGLLESRERS